MGSDDETCDVCQIHGLDSKFLNGKKSKIRKNQLHKVLVGKVATVKLCHIHDIELFNLGEKRFVMEHLDLLRSLIGKAD